MARWTASAKWAAGPALDGQRDMPLALRLSEGLGHTGARQHMEYLKYTAEDRHVECRLAANPMTLAAEERPVTFAPVFKGAIAFSLDRGVLGSDLVEGNDRDALHLRYERRLVVMVYDYFDASGSGQKLAIGVAAP